MKKCLYCGNETTDPKQLCSRECRIKQEQREDDYFLNLGLGQISKPLGEIEKRFQLWFQVEKICGGAK